MPRRRGPCINCGTLGHRCLCNDCIRAAMVSAVITAVATQIVRLVVG